jgi:hypothetical protein
VVKKQPGVDHIDHGAPVLFVKVSGALLQRYERRRDVALLELDGARWPPVQMRLRQLRLRQLRPGKDGCRGDVDC